MREHYFDRAGEPIDIWTWNAKFSDPRYSQIKLTVLVDGGRERVVSTMWGGIDRNPGGDAPLLFESTILAPGQRARVVARYATATDAELGHVDVVAAEMARMGSPVVTEPDESMPSILARWAEPAAE